MNQEKNECGGRSQNNSNHAKSIHMLSANSYMINSMYEKRNSNSNSNSNSNAINSSNNSLKNNSSTTTNECNTSTINASRLSEDDSYNLRINYNDSNNNSVYQNNRSFHYSSINNVCNGNLVISEAAISKGIAMSKNRSRSGSRSRSSDSSNGRSRSGSRYRGERKEVYIEGGNVNNCKSNNINLNYEKINDMNTSRVTDNNYYLETCREDVNMININNSKEQGKILLGALDKCSDYNRMNIACASTTTNNSGSGCSSRNSKNMIAYENWMNNSQNVNLYKSNNYGISHLQSSQVINHEVVS
ncbi:hypothetical protein PMLGA01_090028600, partial [Plasmodium malariae]